jgi:hypothetical protein
VLLNKPLPGDEDKGYLFSAPMGYVFDKMMHEAGFSDYYVTCRQPTIGATAGGDWEAYLMHHKPAIIIPLGSAGAWLSEQMVTQYRGPKYDPERDSQISKYCGSLLSANRQPRVNWPHYVVPTFEPIDIVKQWKLRDVVISCDLAKAASEFEYWRTHAHTMQPLPKREPKIHFDCFDELLAILDTFFNYPIISNDIETIYPRAPTKTQPSQFYKILPGYPITIGLAPRIDFGISFNLFRESVVESRELWKKLAKLLWEVPSLGQNFFNFDVNFYEMLGFRLPLEKCRDTMIQHHQLWPELPHKLQFLARQYTREIYWKDEGAGWSIKNMDAMKIYNCKDVMVTLEIYYAQLEEMKVRGLE